MFIKYLLMKNTLTSFVFLIIATFSFAQSGIQGTVIDSESTYPVMSANIIIDGTKMGTYTDFDGKYNLAIPAGTYSITFSSMGFNSKTIKNVIIKGNELKTVNILLSPASEQLDEVVIIEENNKRASATAVQAIRAKSAKIIDGISSEIISKNGDSNVASAIKRVTGVSVEGGKYIFVRGLSDRYSKTTLNGVTIPGLDPDKNTVQMNLFPTSLIDNLIVYKTFLPDLPGDFTGGLVDISTKNFPSKKTLAVGVGTSYTANMNLNNDFVLYESQKLDWLGLGNNARKLGFNENTTIPDESLNDPKLTSLTKTFSKELGVKNNASSFLNHNFNISYGNSVRNEVVKKGINLAFSYAHNYKFYDDVKQGVFYKNPNNTITDLNKREFTTGSIGESDVMWSILAAGGLKYEKSKYSLSFFHSQNGTGKAAQYIANNFDSTGATLYKNAISYSQKSVSNILLNGKHYLKENKYKIDWKISPTLSRILEPDVRSTRLSYDNTTDSYHLQLGDGAGINRYYRSLNEVNLVSKVDVTIDAKVLKDEKSKIKFGFANTFKYRDYKILDFAIEKTASFDDFSQDPNTILADANIWNSTSQHGVYVTGQQNLNNQYNATNNIAAGYIMNELKLNSKLKTIYGFRVENAMIYYDGYYNNQIFKQKVHNETVLLPALNFIYALKEKTNLRFSYAKTVARPSFKEKSNSYIQDPITGTLFIGNLNLKETNITNVDLRWEKFFSSGELISFSGFYKYFNNAIEIVPFQLNPNDIQPKNTSNALLFGGEFEIKKSLTKESAKTHFNVATNITYINSKVDTKKVIVDVNNKTEYELRQENARTGETVSQYRTMQGQSPLIINLSLNASNDKYDANLSYNVQGKKLALVGSGIVPDVYEKPFNSLNFKFSYKLGKGKINFAAKNILNNNFEQVFESYNATEQIYRSYSKQRSFSVSYSYKFY